MVLTGDVGLVPMTGSPLIRSCGFVVGLSAGILFCGTSAHAQQFPSGTVKLIVNVAAGGITGALAGIVGQGLAERGGKPVVVENRVGGNSAVAAQAVSR